MDNFFLPKAFDLNVNSDYCSHHQYGPNETSPHWHSGAEIIFVVRGKVNIMFNNRWHILEENSMLFIPPKQLHCCKCVDSSAEKIVIGFKEKCLGSGGIGLSLPTDVYPLCIFHALENTPLPRFIKDFNKNAEIKSSNSKDLIAKALLLQIYAYLIEYWSYCGIPVNKSYKSKTNSMIYDYIETHYTEALNPYELAKQFNISYSSLAKAMQEFYHTSFTKCVHEKRIEHAKHLLALTDKSITEVGLECGFCDTSYFIKIFRQLTNITPKAYRNLLKEQPLPQKKS